MEILSIADAVTTLATSQGLGFDKSFPSVTRVLFISAGISVDTIERPRIRHNRCRSIPRSFTRKKRRTRKRSQTGGGGGDSDDGEGNSFFGDGKEGPFGGSFGDGDGDGGGGSGGGGGRGWNFDGYGGSDWDDSSSSPSDPAFDFVYEVLSWIILSNCLHFAFKKVVRIIADGAIGGPSRE